MPAPAPAQAQPAQTTTTATAEHEARRRCTTRHSRNKAATWSWRVWAVCRAAGPGIADRVVTEDRTAGDTSAATAWTGRPPTPRVRSTRPAGTGGFGGHHEHQPLSAVATIAVTGGCRHPGCRADGVHGPGRRTTAGQHWVHGTRLVRLQLQLRGQGRPESARPVNSVSSSPTPTTAATPSARRSRSTGPSTRSIRWTESMFCIGQNPPPGGNELIFLGRYRVKSSAPSNFPCARCGTPGPAAVPFRGHGAGQRQGSRTVTRRLFPDHAVERDGPDDRTRPVQPFLHPGRYAIERQSHRRLALCDVPVNAKEAEQ